MGEQKASVFIASRFDEFRELRAALCASLKNNGNFAPIDLNDGYARHTPPLAECLSRVRACDLFVLLLGESYGGNAPGRSKSFTHLEYEEAVSDRSKAYVLVYRVRDGGARSDRPIPDEWLRQLDEMHTFGKCTAATHEGRATEITLHAMTAFHELTLGRFSAEDEDAGALDGTDDLLEDDAEVDALEASEAHARGALDSEVEADVTDRRPAALAALEQREEAERAVVLRERAIAIQHLRKALEYRPLDGPSNLLLARLYLASGRRDRLGDVVNLAERAARIAAEADLPYRAATALLLTARAHTEMGDTVAAHRALDQALHYTEKFAKVHLERARVLCAEDRLGDAVDAVRQAFGLHASSLHQALRDPHLRAIRRDVHELLRTETSRSRAEVQHLLDLETQLCGLAQSQPTAATPSPSDGLGALRRLGQESMARQLQLVSALLEVAERGYRDSLVETRGSSAAQLTAKLAGCERELADARTQQAHAAQALEAARALPWRVDLGAVISLIIGAWAALLVDSTIAAGSLISMGVVLAARLQWIANKKRSDAEGRLAAATEAHAQAVARHTQCQHAHEATQNELVAMRERGAAFEAVATQALALFEGQSLSKHPRHHPFPTLRRAQPGKLVRLSPQTIKQFWERYKRKVEQDPAPFWPSSAQSPEGFALYRVSAVTPSVIRVSRSGVYTQPAARASTSRDARQVYA